jgi:kumamolisin
VAHAYTPSQIAAAYDYAPLLTQGISGAGQTVALLELDRLNPNDLTLFDTSYGLPAPDIRQVYAGGAPFPLAVGGETAFDVEWLHALAPGAKIRVYYLDNTLTPAASWKQLADVLDQAASDGAGIVSISLAACRAGRGSVAAQQAFRALFQRDVSVFVSSGDYGDHPGPKGLCGNSIGLTYPGSDPYVVSVGGTSLLLTPAATIATEIAWRGSGGGLATGFPRIPWQRAPQMPDGTHRWVPDVAFLGDKDTGVGYITNGTWAKAGGTSLGAPGWAAAWALVRELAHRAGKTAGPAPRLIYSIGNSAEYQTDFHDITTGSNGKYHAGPGWDPVTGWGTPDVAHLAATVAAISPPQ